MRWTVTRSLVFCVVFVALGGCRGPKPQQGRDDRAPPAVLRLLPEEAQFVVAMDVAKVRAAPITAKLDALRVVFDPLVKQIAALTAKTGVDPWTQLDSVALGGVSLQSNLAIVLRGRSLDEARLTAYAREQLAGDGDELIARKHGKRTIWSARKRPDSAGVFLDGGTLVLATPGWAERIVDLADGGSGGGRSAATNPELVAACAHVSASPLWAAGVLPDEARKVLQYDLDLRAVASMKRATIAVDLAEALVAKATVDFGEAAQAEDMAEDLAALLARERRAKRDSPYMQSLFKGLTEYADGATLRAELRLENDVAVRMAETTARFINWSRPASELPAPTTRALTMKPDWLTPPSTIVTLSDVRSYDAWDRQTHALFEVTNRSDKPALADIRIRYRDQDDKRLDERGCPVPMLVLLPHESVGCDTGLPAGAASGIYTIRTAPDDRAAEIAAKSRRTLTVVGARLEPPRGAVQWLAGHVKNTTTSVVRVARIHATFHDAHHKIVGYGDAVAQPPQIAPGASAEFRLASGPLFAPAKSFSAIAYSVNLPKPR